MKPAHKKKHDKARNNLRNVTGLPTARSTATGIKPGFPNQRVVDLTYAQFGTLTSGTGGSTKQAFRLNSAFDPDFSGVGSQPTGFDQWSLLYNHYVVEKSTIVALIDGYSAAPLVAGIYVSDDSTIPSDASELIALGADYSLVSNGTVPTKFVTSVNVGRFFGRHDVAADSELRATTGANPTEQVFGTLFFQGIDRLTALSVGWSVKIIYTVRFMEPRDLNPSLLTEKGCAGAKLTPTVALPTEVCGGDPVLVNKAVCSCGEH